MDNKERFIEIFTSQIHRPGAAELLEWLESTDFFEAPASTHYHGSYPGGLVEHSLNVYYELIGAGRVPGVPTAETYAVVALLHDICKADFYAQSTRNQNPRLCTDTLHDGGGLNVLCIDFCPLCGREMEKQEALG